MSTPSRAALARDAALERVRRTRRWVIAGTAALTAGVAGLVSAVAPGRSLATKGQPGTQAANTGSARGSSSTIPPLPPPATPGSLGLQGPNQAPSPAPNSLQPSTPPPAQAPAPSSGGGGSVVSGGS